MENRFIQKSFKIFFKRNMNIKMMVQRCIIKKKKLRIKETCTGFSERILEYCNWWWSLGFPVWHHKKNSRPPVLFMCRAWCNIKATKQVKLVTSTTSWPMRYNNMLAGNMQQTISLLPVWCLFWHTSYLWRNEVELLAASVV